MEQCVRHKICCHISTNHNLEDDRIFWKEALSLKGAGYEVVIIGVVDVEACGYKKCGVDFIPVKRPKYSKNTLINNLVSWLMCDSLEKRILGKARETKAHIFHLHDFRLYRIISILRTFEQLPRIIVDVHDPHVQNVIDYRLKKRFPSVVTSFLAWVISRYELSALESCDQVVVTEPNVWKYFSVRLPGIPVSVIYNYANVLPTGISTKTWDAIYCGTVTRARGILHVINAVLLVKKTVPSYKLCIVGRIWEESLRADIKAIIKGNDLDDNVTIVDEVPYESVGKYYEQSRVGLALFQPLKTHEIIMPIKLFEYVQFRLPIVGCNFGHVGDFIVKEQVGLAVDSTSVVDIAAALVKMSTDYDLYESFSLHCAGSSPRFRWENMETELFNIYQRLLMEPVSFTVLTVLNFEWQAAILSEILTEEGISNFVSSNSSFGPTTGFNVSVDSSKIEQAHLVLKKFDESNTTE